MQNKSLLLRKRVYYWKLQYIEFVWFGKQIADMNANWRKKGPKKIIDVIKDSRWSSALQIMCSLVCLSKALLSRCLIQVAIVNLCGGKVSDERTDSGTVIPVWPSNLAMLESEDWPWSLWSPLAHSLPVWK